MLNSDTSSAPSHTYGSVGDAAALKICPLEFKEKKIWQSNPYPCAQNKICVSLKPGAPVHKGDKIKIAQLSGALDTAGVMKISTQGGESVDIL